MLRSWSAPDGCSCRHRPLQIEQHRQIDHDRKDRYVPMRLVESRPLHALEELGLLVRDRVLVIAAERVIRRQLAPEIDLHDILKRPKKGGKKGGRVTAALSSSAHRLAARMRAPHSYDRN